jgi:hypothetical protein
MEGLNQHKKSAQSRVAFIPRERVPRSDPQPVLVAARVAGRREVTQHEVTQHKAVMLQHVGIARAVTAGRC